MSTLRELLKTRYTLDYDDYPRWSLSLADLDRAEKELTAPLHAEIAALRENGDALRDAAPVAASADATALDEDIARFVRSSSEPVESRTLYETFVVDGITRSQVLKSMWTCIDRHLITLDVNLRLAPVAASTDAPVGECETCEGSGDDFGSFACSDCGGTGHASPHVDGNSLNIRVDDSIPAGEVHIESGGKTHRFALERGVLVKQPAAAEDEPINEFAVLKRLDDLDRRVEQLEDAIENRSDSMDVVIETVNNRLTSLEGTDDPEYDTDDMPVVSKRMAAAARRAYKESYREATERARWKIAIQAALVQQGRREDVE